MEKELKILGGLLGAAVGDAMGSPTETRSAAQIIEKFGGIVDTFVKSPSDVFTKDFEAGSISDDFSLAYHTALAIIENKGVVNDDVAKNALINWSKTPYYVLAGPTTVSAVDEMLGKKVNVAKDFLTYDCAKGSDGGAMKISPVGLCSGGNVEKAIEDAIVICKPTHFNSTALAGACAVAGAVAEALNDDSTIDSIIEAGLKGAKYGNEYGIKNGKELANPSVYKRIILAVEIADRCNGDMEMAKRELEDIIGSGLSAAETVPCVFGLLKASNGNTKKAIVAGVNIGNDTDTVATIVGAIAGTYEGYYDEEYLNIINRVNNLDLKDLAKKINEVSNG